MQTDNGNLYSRMSRSLKRQNPQSWEFSPVFRTTSALNPLVLSLQVGRGSSHSPSLRDTVKVLQQNLFPAREFPAWSTGAVGFPCPGTLCALLPLCSSTLHVQPHQLPGPCTRGGLARKSSGVLSFSFSKMLEGLGVFMISLNHRVR